MKEELLKNNRYSNLLEKIPGIDQLAPFVFFQGYVTLYPPFEEMYGSFLKRDTLHRLEGVGMVRFVSDGVWQLNPFLVSNLRRSIRSALSEKEMNTLQDRFLQLMINRSKSASEQLSRQDTEIRQETLNCVRYDLGNYLWAGTELLVRRSDFFDPFRIAIDYWYLSAEYEKVIVTCQKIITRWRSEVGIHANPRYTLGLVKILEAKGRAHYALGQFSKTEEAFLSALQFHQTHQIEKTDKQVLGRIHQYLGINSRMVKDYVASETHLKKALGIFEECNDLSSKWAVMQNYGNLLLVRNRLEEAIEIYLHVLPALEQKAEKYSIGEIYQNLGLAHRRLKKSEEAEAYYHQALDIFRQFGDERGMAQIMQNLGVVYWDRKLFAKAEGFYKEALLVYIRLQDFQRQAKIYQNLGVLAKNLGELEDSLTYYQKAGEFYRRVGDRHTSGKVFFNMAVVYWKKKDFSQSEAHFLKAKAVFEEFDDRNQIGNVHLNLGVLYRSWGEVEKGHEHSLAALQMLEATNDFPHLAQTALNLGISAFKDDRPAESERFLVQARRAAKKANDRYRLALINKNLCHSYLVLKKFQPAADSLITAWRLFQEYPSEEHRDEMVVLARAILQEIAHDKLQTIAESGDERPRS